MYMSEIDDKTAARMEKTATSVQFRKYVNLERFKGSSYEGFSLISKGGMGTILRTTDVNCSREVAMKMALNSEEGHESLTHLLHEARVTANLEHPNIVPVRVSKPLNQLA